MTECKPSAFLRSAAPRLKEAIAKLGNCYDYVSVLGTDSKGTSYRATPGETRAGDSNWSERGFVFRAQKNGVIVEHAFNALSQGDIASSVSAALDPLFAASKSARKYPPIPDESEKASRFGTVGIDPESADTEAVLAKLAAAGAAVKDISPEIVFSSAVGEFVQVAKIFISANRDLEQGNVWGQAFLTAVGKRGDVTKENYQPFSGLKGLELLDEMMEKSAFFARETVELLDSGKMEPGEYDVIMDPDITGTLAHEAFGHGVEMDMFVKARAKAVEYVGKPVASSMVQMYDGADGAEHCGSYLFDDEGRMGTKTQIIKDGILVSGISDLQSAMLLGTFPTGNGRRQAFDHKAYARMTNTYFAPGKNTHEEMVASVKHGWLLQKMNSGMEDPKNWGIQLVVLVGREILDGKLSGKLVSPVVCSGYVPDVLSAISMLSGDFKLSGSGACGKGYKEFVKVSAGGPYVKTRMRLG